MVTTAGDELSTGRNVLVYPTDQSSPLYQPASQAIESWRRRGGSVVISPQIIPEYVAVLTRLHVTLGRPPLTEILENARTFLRDFRLVPRNDAVVMTLLDLVHQVPLAGKQVHDACIVATMFAHGIPRLLTHNTANFARFSSFITVVPLVPSR